MQNSIDLLKKYYLDSIKENPTTYVGIELELPIVNLSGDKTDTSVTKALLVFLADSDDFEAVSKDLDGNVIEVKHILHGDIILFELSYNTLEFAFEKSLTIQDVESRFKTYLDIIQGFLMQHHHMLVGEGIHPSWDKNDNSPVNIPRYQMLIAYLKSGEKYPEKSFHSFYDYGTFICGNQVQLDVTRDTVVRLINAFDKIEVAKAYLFANSVFPELDDSLRISRDIFWEKSMHGFYPQNVGLYQTELEDVSDLLNALNQTVIFNTIRNEEILCFEPIKVKDYLATETILATRLDGKQIQIKPQETDFVYHRSYHYQSLTKRGTIEFRSVCAQPLDKTFIPIAFHLGLHQNLEELEELLATSSFYKEYHASPSELRRRFSRYSLTNKERQDIQELSKQLVLCAIAGLKQRPYGEENYLYDLLAGLQS